MSNITNNNITNDSGSAVHLNSFDAPGLEAAKESLLGFCSVQAAMAAKYRNAGYQQLATAIEHSILAQGKVIGELQKAMEADQVAFTFETGTVGEFGYEPSSLEMSDEDYELGNITARQLLGYQPVPTKRYTIFADGTVQFFKSSKQWVGEMLATREHA